MHKGGVGRIRGNYLCTKRRCPIHKGKAVTSTVYRERHGKQLPTQGQTCNQLCIGGNTISYVYRGKAPAIRVPVFTQNALETT